MADRNKVKMIFCLLENALRQIPTYLEILILKIGPLVQKLLVMAHVSKICPIFGGPILPYKEKVPFFIFSILRHMHEEAIFQKTKKSLGDFFVQPPKCKIYPKFHRFFSKNGSQNGQIQIALNYKNVFRRMGTYLDSIILKIGPLV